MQETDGVGVRLGGCRRPAANPLPMLTTTPVTTSKATVRTWASESMTRVVGSRQEEVIGQSAGDRGDHPGGASADRGRGHHHEQVEDDDVLQADGALKGFDE